MNRIAKIVNGVAVDFRIPSEFTPPDGETWVASPDYVQRLSLYSNGAWCKPDGSPYTDSEQQTVSTQLSLYSRLSAAERRAIRTLANTDSPVGDVALQVEGALFAAVETESRNQQTKMLIGAVMQLGIVASIDRARELLNDPDFTLE